MTAWTDITKPTSGTALSKANYGDPVVDNLNILRADACVVKRTTNQTLTHDTETSLLWDADREDSNSMHDTSSNTNRIVLTRPGLYLVTLSYLQFAAHANGTDTVFICDDDGDYLAWEARAGNAGIPNTFNMSCIITGGNQWIEVKVKQSSGGNLDIVANAAGTSPNFAVTLLKDLSTS